MTTPEDTSFFCSVYSASAGEQLWGTAPHADVWFALEYPHPWGAEALAESSIPASVKAHLAAIPKARVQLIRQPERVAGGVAFLVAVAGRLYRFHLGAYEELLTLDLAGVIAGAPDYERFLSVESLFLVCVNGKRDKCCAKYGLPVYEAMSRAAGLSVWQCSHLAGHRFAATCVILPQGLVYGRLAPDDAAALVASHRRGEIALEHYRGNAGYEETVQAAEYYMRAQTGNRAIGAVRLIEMRPGDGADYRVHFESDGKRHIIDLSRRISAFDLIKSCREVKGAPGPQYTLVSERNEQMYSTRCTSCKQIITLKGDEIKAAIDEAEAAKRNIYEMKCPKCRRPVRIQVKMLKLKLPRPVPESLDGKAAGQETEAEAEDTDKA